MVVYGSGRRAAEQALVAAKAGAKLAIYSPDIDFHEVSLAARIHAAGIQVFRLTEILSLVAAPKRHSVAVGEGWER